jgi:hypothetical protein
MVRKTLVALATAATLGAAALVPGTAAAAHGFHGGGFHGHVVSRPIVHNRFVVGHRFGHRPFFVRRHIAFVGVPLVASDSCVAIRRVWTRWGWHWRRVWVC